MIETRDLTFSYPGGILLRFPDFRCRPEEQWLILGESGSGKTTFLHLLAGIRSPGSGQVIIRDQDITSLSPKKLDAFRGRHIGLVFQTPHFIDALTIRQNVVLACKMSGHSISHGEVDTWLNRLGIGHRADALPFRCSQGEQQRASIVRALVHRPALLLADEPTSALDDRHCDEVVRLLLEQTRQSQTALVIVTHDQRLRNHFPNALILTSHVQPLA